MHSNPNIVRTELLEVFQYNHVALMRLMDAVFDNRIKDFRVRRSRGFLSFL